MDYGITLGEFREFTKDLNDDAVFDMLRVEDGNVRGMQIMVNCADGRDHVLLHDYLSES